MVHDTEKKIKCLHIPEIKDLFEQHISLLHTVWQNGLAVTGLWFVFTNPIMSEIILDSEDILRKF